MDKIIKKAQYFSAEVLESFRENPLYSKFSYEINLWKLKFTECEIEKYKNIMTELLFEFDLSFENGFEGDLIVKGKRKNVPHLISDEIFHEMKLTELKNFRNKMLGSL